MLYSSGSSDVIPAAVNNSDTSQNRVGFPSGQREQTVNLPSQTLKVRVERSETTMRRLRRVGPQGEERSDE
ncbi:hypothetical protein KS18_01770 [Photorhabdus luminescens]|nr:hypothetical protein KS18_01770 [Photorhabdus luminescens]